MPNEQTSVPLFTAGEVLTAANMNISAGTGVPVFSNTTTRDAGFGGAGEKVLAEGQLCYLSSTNVVQYYDGAAWATVGPSTAGGLVYLTGASFSAAASVSLPASTFTSTYTNYRLHIQITSASGTFTLTGRMRASGTDNTAAKYQSGSPGCDYNGSATNLSNNDSTSFNLKGGSSSGTWAGVFDIMQPQLAQETTIYGQINGYNGAVTFGNAMNMAQNTTSIFDSFSFIAATSTITGYYKVYGYTNS